MDVNDLQAELELELAIQVSICMHTTLAGPHLVAAATGMHAHAS